MFIGRIPRPCYMPGPCLILVGFVMVTKTWNGSTDFFAVASDWVPAGVPVAGDTAIITAGVVTDNTVLPSGLTIALNSTGGSNPTRPIFALGDGFGIPQGVQLTSNTNAFATVLGSIGTTFNAGAITFAGAGSGAIALADRPDGSAGQLLNSGTVSFVGVVGTIANVDDNPSNAFVNNGTINVTDAVPVAGSLLLSANISGNGTINLAAGDTLRFTQGASGQTVVLGAGSAGSIVQIDKGASWASSITGFGAADTITITSAVWDAETFTPLAGGAGAQYTFSNAGTPVANIVLNGTGYSQSSVTVSTSISAASETTTLRTTVPDNVASPPGGGANGGSGATNGNGGSGATNGNGNINSATVGVYRFFDTRLGTHFFTASATEKGGLIDPNSTSFRSDLVEETNGFGAIDPAVSDTNEVSVYRFFDSTFGTHFFTASASERNSLTDPNSPSYRPDLIFEASSSFLEHSTQHAGDLAVYRFFDSVHGTHFYTGDAGEFAAITTPGTGAYRPDLISEGVAFYAPTGNFT
jgi:hypothetical protein